MIDFNKGVLPHQITQHDVMGMVGEYLYWFCGKCRRWHTTKIKANGVILCPKCGAEPDWKKHPPTLAYKSRYKRVAALCAEGSDFRKSCDETERCYDNFIEATYEGLPHRAQNAGCRHFSDSWKRLDEVADYLLAARDAPEINAPYAYDEKGLQRRYFDSRRGCNVVSLCDSGREPVFDDGGAQYTDQETAEITSYKNGFTEQSHDKYFADEFLNYINHPLERAVALDLYHGEKKRDVERKYALTERQVRTITKHLAKALKDK